MKKLLLPLLSLALSATAWGADTQPTATVDGLEYTATSATEASVTGYDDATVGSTADIKSTVTIEGKDYTVTSVGERAFNYSKITTAKFPATLTTLEYCAFYNCELANVEFSTGLKTIGDNAFGYTKISEMAIPEGVETIGGSAFFRADNLVKITFPSTLKTIGGSCFYKCPLTEVTLPEGLTTLGKSAFYSCAKLTKVSLPSTLTKIAEATFRETALSEINLNEGITEIGRMAFYKTQLTSVAIPASVAEIGGSAFVGSPIATWSVAAGSKNFCTVNDELLYTADKRLLIAMAPASKTTKVTIDPECIGISSGAFDNSAVEEVVLGDKMRALDEFAFCQSKLAKINFPKSLVYIGEQAFAGTNLTSVELPENLPLIQSAVFAQCTSLTTVSIPASVQQINIRAFWECKALTTVNCYGMTPPEFDYWEYTTEKPFYNVPSTCVCNVPAGTADAYKKAWSGGYDGKFAETLPAAFVPTAFSPADGAIVSSFDGVTITFGEAATVVKKNPEITVIAGRLAAGVPIGDKVAVDQWIAVQSGTNGIKIFPADYDDYTAAFNMEDGKDYYVTIPAGTVKNAAGALNAEITLHYAGSYVKPVIKLVSVSPADGSKLAELCNFEFTFEEPVTLVENNLQNVKVTTGSPTGESVYVEYWWAAQKSGTKIHFFSSDEYDGYAQSIKLKKGLDYYVTLPAGLFRLNSSYSTVSDEIVLHYTHPETQGIDDIEADEEAPVEIYTVDGIRINSDNIVPGRLYIKRQGSKVTKMIAK